MRSFVLALLCLALALPVFASDGVVEINQTCATETGCFSGDMAGFPVTINGNAGRSYRLTSDLLTPDENTSGISIDTSDIAIDLNEFTIIRLTCQGVGHVNCTPTTGSGSGIVVVNSLDNRGISVKNGVVTGTGGWGVRLGPQATVTNVRVRWNHFAGIFVGGGSTLSGNSAYQNGESGIAAGGASTLLGNSAFGNGIHGISGGNGSTISANAAAGNASAGIQCGVGCVVRGNSVRDNSFGLLLGSDSAYGENVVTMNTTATVSGGITRGNNYCSCPAPQMCSAFCP